MYIHKNLNYITLCIASHIGILVLGPGIPSPDQPRLTLVLDWSRLVLGPMRTMVLKDCSPWSQSYNFGVVQSQSQSLVLTLEAKRPDRTGPDNTSSHCATVLAHCRARLCREMRLVFA